MGKKKNVQADVRTVIRDVLRCGVESKGEREWCEKAIAVVDDIREEIAMRLEELKEEG